MTETLDVTSVAADDPAAQGRAARAASPRRGHGEWAPAADRRDPLAILAEEDRTRVVELVPIRYGRMATSPFAFYRGSASVMAADLADTPTTGLRVQLCGDAHLLNFGIYAAPDRRLVFDINDFDESAPGPWEWDAKRLAASFAIAGRHAGLRSAARGDAVRAAIGRYRTALREFAAMRHIDVFYARMDVDAVMRDAPRMLSAERVATVNRSLAKARKKDSLRAMAKLTEEVDGEVRLRSEPPLLVRIQDLVPPDEARDIGEELRALIAQYAQTLPLEARRLVERYRLVDLARKVVGVGSVGTRAWIALLLGRDARDPLVLQIKEAETSVVEPYAGPAGYDNHGRRVVEGQRLMQATGDVLLGWLHVSAGLDGNERDFYVRQLWDGKASANLDAARPEDLATYGQLCGWTLARAHARSGDAAAIGAYLGRSDTFERALVPFAEAYADQNERDHGALVEAIRAGRIEAVSDV